MHNQQKKLQEQKEIALIFKQILLTDTVRKCMEISQENLYVDIRTIRTLTRRAQLVCDPLDTLTDENNVFSKNNYNEILLDGMLTKPLNLLKLTLT